MSLLTSSMQLFGKYGKAAKVVVSGVLNVVAPGSGTLLDLAAGALDGAGEVTDTASDLAEKSQRDRWEEELRARLGTSAAELARLGQLLDCLVGPLAVLCDKAAVFADQAEDLPDIIARALASNPGLSQALHGIEGIKFQFEAFHADLRRVAQTQADALPVYERMNRVADYFDELWAAGIKPKDFAGSVLSLLESAAATRDGDYPAAQRALQTAVHLRPHDADLAELSRRVTVLATRATPKSRPPAPAPAPPPARLQAGDTLDDWVLEARLGAGGWGQVFRASREGKTRAVKVMHPDFAADRAFVERFKKEIEALIRLPRHANLVGVEGFGYCTSRQTWYLVMEYLDGPTLEKYLADKGPLTEGQVCKVFSDLIEGLARAHAAGIVHRDIKPGNLIFRQTDQRLVLVDFGLAVAVDKIGETQIGGISVAFAAPEQHYGESATQASDVFSLCAVIHYALSYDKPELRKPHCFTAGLAPESLRQALTAGLRANVSERLRDGGQLHAALSAKDAVVRQPQPKRTQPQLGDTISNELGMKFAWVPPGKSWLGGGAGKPGTKESALALGLWSQGGVWCGIYPVTQAEWQAVMGSNPAHFGGNPQYPVESVSWNDVQAFLKKLNAQLRGSGVVYHLPAEGEWEFICRGGPIPQSQSGEHFYFARSKTDLTVAPTNDLSSSQANFNGNYPAGLAAKGPYLGHPCEVGRYPPNPLGCYDLHGNVWEWTSSQQGSSRVVRGGGWNNWGAYCTAVSRDWYEPSYRGNRIGFRLLAVRPV